MQCVRLQRGGCKRGMCERDYKGNIFVSIFFPDLSIYLTKWGWEGRNYFLDFVGLVIDFFFFLSRYSVITER